MANQTDLTLSVFSMRMKVGLYFTNCPIRRLVERSQHLVERAADLCWFSLEASTRRKWLQSCEPHYCRNGGGCFFRTLKNRKSIFWLPIFHKKIPYSNQKTTRHIKTATLRWLQSTYVVVVTRTNRWRSWLFQARTKHMSKTDGLSTKLDSDL